MSPNIFISGGGANCIASRPIAAGSLAAMSPSLATQPNVW
jgi:hypothetical protein